MRHVCIILLACIAVFTGRSFAQNIQTDTQAALGEQWKTPDGALHCLKALKLYTADPVANAEEALKELNQDGTVHEDLYKVAQNQAGFLDWLATACDRASLDRNVASACKEQHPDPGIINSLFVSAKVLIERVYDAKGGKSALDDVNKSSSAKLYHLALFQLLSTYRRPDKDLTTVDCSSMEILRLCYKVDRDRLFKLVDTKISPKE
jgi:hypothetical protein